MIDYPTLSGQHIRLEPLGMEHIDGLVAAAGADPTLYRWSPVPQGKDQVRGYIATALAWRDAGTAVPFATVRRDDNVVIGSTRFWNVERWAWPTHHANHGRATPDACEIGYTWLTRSAIRTATNTEAKFLMLSHAFEMWKVWRVCFHTDIRNERSRTALARIGAQCEGVLRGHRLAADNTIRDSVRFSIVAAEWPSVREKLQGRLNTNES